MENKNNEESVYLVDLQNQLAASELYKGYKKIVSQLRLAFYNKAIGFDDTAEYSFAKEVFYRIMEESIGYIATLEQGAFFSSNHHTRALLELYATVEYVFSSAGKNKNFISRFNSFPKIAFYKVFHQHDDAFLKLSQDICHEFLTEYGELNAETLEAFGSKQREEALRLRSWRGNAEISNLFERCPRPEVIKSDYEKLCLFVHFSSICRRSELEIFPKFCKNTERMLLITIRYAIFSYAVIKEEGLLNESLQNQLDDIFLPIVDPLTKSHADFHGAPKEGALLEV